MAYIRKTTDEYQLLANHGQGWEHETTEQTRAEIKERLKEYRANAPQYSYKIVTKRVKITN
jgi:hypothetical protein